MGAIKPIGFCPTCHYYVRAKEPDYQWQGTCHRYPIPEMDNAGPGHWCGEYIEVPVQVERLDVGRLKANGYR